MRPMTASKSKFSDDRTKSERRKDLSPQEIKDLELAGGVEGGMRAGSAGGPGEKDKQPSADDTAGPTNSGRQAQRK